MTDINKYEYSVVPTKIDFNGQITVPSLCAHAIDAIAKNIRVEGHGVDVLAKEQKTWVLLHSAFEIDQRPLLYEPMYVTVYPVAGRCGITYNRCIQFIDSDGNEFGRGTTEWCVIDIQSRKPVISSYEPIKPKHKFPCAIPRRIRDFIPQIVDNRKVRYSECDFNGHLNNIKYLDMFYDLLPENMLNLTKKIRLDINYRQEVLRGTDISIGLKEEEQNRFLFIARRDNTTLCSASLCSA